MPAIKVGTATSAAYAARRLVTSFSCKVINDKLAETAVVTISRELSID